jgi:hypothetical protein
MANRKFLAGMLAITLALGIVGCGKGAAGGGDGFTITGIPSEYNGKYAMLNGLAGANVIVGYESNENKLVLSRIANGKVSIPLWRDKDGGVTMKNTVKYSGSDTALGLAVNIYDDAGGGGDVVATAAYALVKFSNGNAAKSWSGSLTK